MKILDKLEKSKTFWAILCISIGFFILRLPSVVEPNWYGDEGIYQIMGMAINNGSILYSDVWDNKPPLLYIVYSLFNGDQFGVRLASLLVGLLSCWLFFYLSQKLFEKIKISIISTSIFAFLFAIPLIEGNIANAENFMLFPIISAAILIYKAGVENRKIQNKKYLFITGLLLGIAFLFKIVAIFDLAAFTVFYLIITLPKKISWLEVKKVLTSESGITNPESWFLSLINHLLFITVGFIIPILITTFYFLANNALGDFIKATFFGNIGYVGYANKLIIPQGLLILKLLILAIFVLFVTLKHNKFSKTSIFILIWVAFSLFNALFSQRPYTHYMLVLLPGLCLLIGLILNEKDLRSRNFFALIFIIMVLIVGAVFKPYGFKKTVLYYQNFFLFVSGKKDVISYQAFFDRKTPRDYQLASFIRINSNKNDKIFIWGDSAQIYALSHTLPINKYTVAYHILQSREGIQKTQNDINTVKPKYVIILSESPNFPFKVNSYDSKFVMDRAVIYERSF